MTIDKIHSFYLKCSSITIDTRKIKPNCFFVALKGTNTDGNQFAEEALNKGASYALIDNESFYIDERTILVPNSLKSLQELAHFHRISLKTPIIALTGSNGKTTTKELICTVLSKKYNVKATVGNLNNHIGVPLTLLSFNNNTEIGIVEMGANHQKEIELLCKIAVPDFGYITNYGKAHLEGFGGTDGVIKGKTEMYDSIKQNKKIAFVNLDDSIQDEKTKTLNRYSFAISNKNANLIIKEVKVNPFVEINYANIKIKTQLIGLYNATNCNAAIAIGTYFKVSDELIKNALENYKPDNNRSQILNKDTNKIILDAYNANPSSMNLAILNFIELDEKNKILILGDMFELGNDSNKEHEFTINQLKNQIKIQCFFIGNHFYANKININHFSFFESFETFSNYLKKNPIKNSCVLIKGSRGMALEKVLDFI